jgi:uncharacterized membrane protein YgcG
MIGRLILAAALLALTTTTRADERILSYHSDIQITAAGELLVTETIRVRAERKQIKRGIFRDFPLHYTDAKGTRSSVTFDLVEVTRDGRTETYHTKTEGAGIRIYIGHKDRILKPGEYTYTIRYRTSRQLGFFAEHDELYWNVTGNDWAFPIDQASASVALPSSAVTGVGYEAYTGPRGAKGQAYRAQLSNDGRVDFTTTQPLQRREGLTLVVTWPKGFVHAPTDSEKLGWMLADNAHIITGVVGLALLLCYYVVVWSRVGRDPAAGALVPLYEPPRGFSPASTRFIKRMGYDKKVFSAALINLAIKGHIEIIENDGDFSLVRDVNAKAPLAPGESKLLSKLLGASSVIELERSNHARIGGALKAHAASLENDYEKIYFSNNTGWIIPGVLITLLTAAISIWQLPSSPEAFGGIFMAVWLSFWSIGVFTLLTKAWQAWRNVKGVGGLLQALFITAFSIPFLIGEGVGATLLIQLASLPMVLVLLAAAGLNVAFYFWMKAPTLAGRRLLDQIDGFKHYLEVAEKDDLAMRGAPEKSMQRFEQMLPYAIALGVEHAWSEKFAAVIAQAGSADGEYQPGWYRGSHWHAHDIGGFSDHISSSLSSAVASSSTAPGSSSGSGGGGSSGGGGGGGGGGGW